MDNTYVVLCSRLNLGFNLNSFSFFILKFVHLKLFFLTLHISNSCYIEENQTQTITSLIFQLTKIDFRTFLGPTGVYLKSRVIEGSHNSLIYALIFWCLFKKCTFLRLQHYFLA